MKKRNRVVQILMDRDDLTEQEAIETIAECKEMMEEEIADGNYEEAEAIFQSELGLELDYILYVL